MYELDILTLKMMIDSQVTGNCQIKTPDALYCGFFHW